MGAGSNPAPGSIFLFMTQPEDDSEIVQTPQVNPGYASLQIGTSAVSTLCAPSASSASPRCGVSSHLPPRRRVRGDFAEKEKPNCTSTRPAETTAFGNRRSHHLFFVAGTAPNHTRFVECANCTTQDFRWFAASHSNSGCNCSWNQAFQDEVLA